MPTRGKRAAGKPAVAAGPPATAPEKAAPSRWERAVFFVFHYWLVLPIGFLHATLTRYTDKVQRRRQTARYQSIIGATEDQKTWMSTAAALDKLCGYEAWRKVNVKTNYCNQRGIENETLFIVTLRRAANERAIGRYIRTGLHRNLHGAMEAPLFRYYCGTKIFVERYTDAVVNLVEEFAGSTAGAPTLSTHTWRSPASPTESAADDFFGGLGPEHLDADTPEHHIAMLDWACRMSDDPAAAMSTRDKHSVLKNAAQSFGRTALCLSGGASLGVFHNGVIRSLWVAGLLPKIMSGSSAGAIMASVFCTRTDEEVDELVNSGNFLNNPGISLAAFESHDSAEESIKAKLLRLFNTGAFMDVETLMDCLRTNCGDVTFLEAYEKTGRILNVTIAQGSQPMLVNYITAPSVLIWTAVSASCACPGLFTAVQLLQKTPSGRTVPYMEGRLFSDGSVPCDLPKKRLAELFNVNYFIVSQVNPHVVPFLPKPPSQLVHPENRSVMFVAFWLWFCGEVKYWLLKMYRLHVIPRTGRWEMAYLLCDQTYHGDVTIRPIGSVWRAIPEFVNLTTNPTPEHLEYVVCNAQRETWPHLNQIQYATKVERALERALAMLQKELAHEES
jgi:predicted acylesterase/phospholipase RssA